MEPLRRRLREPVGEGLHHDRAVVVVVGLVPLDELVHPEARRDGERADVVGQSRLDRRDEVGERAVRLGLATVGLLAEHRQA